MKEGIRRMRASKLALLKFLCKHFSDNTPFRWEDVVRVGWTGRRWNLSKLCDDHYLRHSRNIKSAYTYARGASDKAKYGQVAPRLKREKVEATSLVGTKKGDTSSQESDILIVMNMVDKKIEELTAIKQELDRNYKVLIGIMPNVSKLLTRTKKALGN